MLQCRLPCRQGPRSSRQQRWPLPRGGAEQIEGRWFWKYLFDGKEKRIALGHYAEVGSTAVRVSLKAAREARDAARKLQRGGIDPARHRQLEKLDKQTIAGATFASVARELHATKSGASGATVL